MRGLTPRTAAGLLAIAGAMRPAVALAHAGEDHSAEPALGWTLSPGVVLPLAAALVIYLVGVLRLGRRSSRRRPPGEAALYLAGWIILAGALLSPLHEGGERSFALHMAEHELIMLPAALMLVAARPGPVLLWGLPDSLRRGLAPLLQWRGWRRLGAPVVATMVQAAALIAWHVPGLFDRALRHEAWHVAQHASFVGAALLFWWAMLPQRGRPEASLVAAMCLFVTSLIGGGLGALMALSASPWYPSYAAMGTMPLGLTPQEDQQIAGLIMWVPGGLFHLIAALWFLGRGLSGRGADQPQKFSTMT